MSQTKTWQQCIEDVIDIGSVFHYQISQGKIVTHIWRGEFLMNINIILLKTYYCEYFFENRSN